MVGSIDPTQPLPTGDRNPPHLHADAEARHRAPAGEALRACRPRPRLPALRALKIALDSGATDPDVLVATLLHDVVEDTPCTPDEVRAQFGDRVGELVAWVTKPEGGGPEQRQRYLDGFTSAPADVLTVKLADRYSNVQRLDTHPRPAKRTAYYAETVRIFLPLAERSPYFRERFGEWAAHFGPKLGQSASG